jgi:transcriptional regulator with XRE-family HTH domain
VAAHLDRRIKTLREAKGLTQEQLAHACGRTSKSTVAKWEAGISSPPAGLLEQVAAALGVTVGDLYATQEEDQAPAAGEAA